MLEGTCKKGHRYRHFQALKKKKFNELSEINFH